MKKLTFKTSEDLYDEVAKFYVGEIKSNPSLTLGLATGSSPIGLYTRLVRACQNSEISFKNITTFNLDEYYGLNPKNSQSYHHFMDEKLFNNIDIKRNNIHIPHNNDAAIDEYEKLLKDQPIDIQLLGIGTNGHIAFNEPGTHFDTGVHKVDLTQKTIQDNSRFFDSIDDVPTQAITVGLKNIMEAKKIILIASGKSKSEIIEKLFADDIVSEDIPASILKNHPNVTFYIDDEANGNSK